MSVSKEDPMSVSKEDPLSVSKEDSMSVSKMLSLRQQVSLVQVSRDFRRRWREAKTVLHALRSGN